MELIVPPIIRNDLGAAVRNLQDGLLLLLTARNAGSPDPGGQTLADRLAPERRDSVYGDATAEVVAQFQRDHHGDFLLPDVTGERVDEATAAAMNKLLEQLGAFSVPPSDDGFVITGRVEFEDGSPGVGLRVDVFDRDLGTNRVELGDVVNPPVTDNEGVFPAIRYRPGEFQEGEAPAGPGADLVFEVNDAQDLSPRKIAALYRRFTIADAAAESRVPDLVVSFDATRAEDVRIVLVGRPSEEGLGEYKRLLAALQPLLLNGATPADFDQERCRDFDFAARETGWDRALVETMSVSWKLATAGRRVAPLLAETFYGLLREGPPTEVAALVAATAAALVEQDRRWRPKLEDSLAHHIIDGVLEEHLRRLRELRTDAAVQPGDGRHGTIGDVLAQAELPEEDRRALLDAYHAHEGTIEEFWTDVVAQRLRWGGAKVRLAQAVLQLAEVLAYDLPLLAQVRDKGLTHPRDLVALEPGEWIDLVRQVGPAPDAPGDTPDEQITRTVNAITAVVGATYPTETMAHVAATSSDPGLRGARDLLARFFENETTSGASQGSADVEGTTFDIRSSPVTTYLEANADRVFHGLNSDDQALLTAQLQRLQRVFRLGGDRVQTEALLDLGLDSAFHITRSSPEQFVADFGERLGGVDRATQVYGRAEAIAGTIVYLQNDLWHGVHAVQPMGIRSAVGNEGLPELKEVPAYRALFGTQKLCDCGHCQSFYGQAAYFVDLLHMLDRTTVGPVNPVDVLFGRRPDLQHIQLTCENTNTLIPYVDLVTEVLEAFVATGMATAFNVPPGPPNRLLPSPSADELRVNPIYLTKASEQFADLAYAALQEATFPLSLPLNLPLETTRTYLDHLGASRADLMTLFDRDDAFETRMARTAEILLLSPEEFEIITASQFGGASSKRPATMPELFGLSATSNATTAFNHVTPDLVLPPAPPPPALPPPPDPRVALIRSLQNILDLISAAPIPVTGIFDKATAAAVTAFQTSKGLAGSGRTDAAFWDALEADGMPPLSVMVCPLPMFLDRSGLTYEDLVALVKTRFVNQTLQGEGDFDYLARLGIPAFDIRAWIQAGLPAMPAAIGKAVVDAGEDPVVFTKWVTRRTRAVVINTGFEAPCDLDRQTLMHLDGSLLSPDELVRLFSFIRLWRKLGWTIEELDHAIHPTGLDGGAALDTLVLLANVKLLRGRTDAPMTDLVTLWQDIPTHGDPTAYDRLFRNRAAQLIDPILQLDRDRLELASASSATPPVLSDHLGVVLAAFRLSALELEMVRTAVGLDDDLDALPPVRPPLNLKNLSAIYKRVALARALRVSLRELLTLFDLAGVAGVFDRPDNTLAGHAVALIDVVDKVRAAGVKVGVLEYLCRAVPQTPGAAGTQRGAWSRTLAELINGLRAITDEDPIADDPNGEELVARLTALVGPDDARTAVDLVYGRDVYKTVLVGLPAPFAFPPAVKGRITYDVARKELRVRGALTAKDLTALLSPPPPGVPGGWAAAIKALGTKPRAFVARALGALFSPAEAEAALIDVSSLDPTGEPLRAVIDAKVGEVLARRKGVLSRGLIKQTLATATGLTADVVELLLEDDTVLTASGGGGGPAMSDYQAVDGDGLDADYFNNPDLRPPSSLARVDGTIGFDLHGKPPAPGILPVQFSVRWTGSLYVPAAGEVAFRVRCTDGVRLSVNGTSVIDEWQDQAETELNATVRLDGGQFYPIEVSSYNKTGDALLDLSWSSPSIPAAVVPQAALYSAARFESLLRQVERIYKLALLLTPFALTAPDLRRLAAHGDIALDLVPLAGPTPLPAAQAMFVQWLALRDFAALRDRYPAGEVSLMDVVEGPTRLEAITRFSTLTGAPADVLDAIVDAFTTRVFDAGTLKWTTLDPDLTTLAWWGRIAEALTWVDRTGAAPAQLLGWAKVRDVSELPTGPETLAFIWKARDEAGGNRQADNTGRSQDAKNVVRARYEEARWRTEAQSLNDVLRIRRRSALTAFVLAMPDMMRARVSDTGRLFEFFLIDPEMDPCMETSRIVQGTASVQLFIQRVLLGLESPQVPPERVDRHRWEWMKNYRVWEANRKVFLYPENYLEPELRDDKTPFFKEFEGELLQDVLTDANAESALGHYLEKLDDVAKLIVCGTCVDSVAGKLHVFARTATTPFVFHHRWLDNKGGLSWTEGQWSPWQKLPVDVASIVDGENSGAHLLPVIWNRRLYLFWPVFTPHPDDAQEPSLPTDFPRIDCWRISLAWSEYKDGLWSQKQTGTPFVVSGAAVEADRKTTFARTLYTPNKIQHPGHWIQIEILGQPVPGTRQEIPGPVEFVPLNTTDPMLEGVILKDGESAWHDQTTTTTKWVSFLPRPQQHYLDATISGSSLSIQVFCRFRGTPKGQQRTVTEDAVTFLRGGERTDRKERSQTDGYAEGNQQNLFFWLGAFDFPACASGLNATTQPTSIAFNSLERPVFTTNSFMALRHEKIGIERVVRPLSLTEGASPVLGGVPNDFEVIDSDNRSGFDRSGPFFYQDSRRCYLVTRETQYALYDSDLGRARPETRAAVSDRATGLAALADRTTVFGPEASLRANPWAPGALVSWANGPGLPVPLRPVPQVPMQTMSGLSGSFGGGDTFTGAVKAQFPEVDRPGLKTQSKYRFTPHWHPYTCPLISALNSGGLPALFTLDNQGRTDAIVRFGSVPPTFLPNNFEASYKPDPIQVAKPYPGETIDFDRRGAYSAYNWEIFFHAPLSVAMALSREGQHEKALPWFHYIFDPMTPDRDTSDKRFWRFLPFRQVDSKSLAETLALLTDPKADPQERANLLASIQEWLDNPFSPHLIARRRSLAYMKSVFMKYLDNLIAWADELFQRDTRESINEAMQLYVLVADLLGPVERRIPAPGPVAAETYASLRGRLDVLSNAQVDLETRLPFTQVFGAPTGKIGQLTKLPQTLYFCLPQNDQLLAYWGTVADRLFKIRHCMNMDGTVRDLPLSDREIDPRILVDAVAHGVDIGSVLSDLYAPLPRQRFAAVFQQALALCNQVRELDGKLLATFEKRDAEVLAALRAGQERQLLDQVKVSKKLQIDEAEQSRQALEETGRMTGARIEYYENLIAEGLIAEETDQLGSLDHSNERQETASWLEASAQLLNLMPNISINTGTPGGTSVSFGGSNVGAAASAVGRSYSYVASSHAYKANRASITGGHTRRMDDWRFQRDHAKREAKQIARQQAAAALRKEFTQAELRNHETALENSRGIEDLLRSKFTNDALYDWMAGQLRTTYFQCYKMAYELARRAQRCFQYQLGTDASIITYGAWDSSVRGLLAGERLYLQLRQLERAYNEQQARELEITKIVSVALLDPLALIELKETGTCEVEIPEWLFDIDYLGHYFRRLKTVSISIPAVVGPTGLCATVTLLASKVRTSHTVTGSYGADENYTIDKEAMEAIAASTGHNDSGRFQLDFRDEKYLPFEGAGAISRWRIELPRKFRAFDYDTISDVVFDVKYTARSDGALAGLALAALQAELDSATTGPLFRLFSIRHDFPNEWQTLQTGTHAATLPIAKDRFPFLVQQGDVTVAEVHAAVVLKEARPAVTYKATITPNGGGPIDLLWSAGSGRYRSDGKTATIPIAAPSPAGGGWRLQLTAPTLPADVEKVRDLMIAVRYSVKMPP